MLLIENYDASVRARKLKHGNRVFHEALRAVLNGEDRFHVINKNGENYDLVYKENNSYVPPVPILKGEKLLPPYYLYDENDEDRLYLEVFEKYNGVVFYNFDEYSVVLTKIILAFTEKEVYIRDERIHWFVDAHERLHVMAELPDYREVNAICCGEQMRLGFAFGDFRDNCDMALFHNVFIKQWLTDLPFSDVKYLELAVGTTLGVGGVLAHYTRMSNALKKIGVKTLLQRESTRFKDEMLEKYFNLDMAAEDSDWTNTAYVPLFTSFVTTHLVMNAQADFDYDILSDNFKKELSEYEEAVIGDKKMLGVLVRGTDYVTSGAGVGDRKMATVDEMMPTIHEWMNEDKYDGIFVATEDQEALEKLRKEFPGKIRAIAQERHKLSDFKDGELIADLEKRERTGDEYYDALEDTTVNYFYALYMLSKCKSFMCSGQCNGWDTVRAFNNGKFERCYLFSVGVGK